MKYEVRVWIMDDCEPERWFYAHGRQRVPVDTTDGGDATIAAFSNQHFAEQFAYLCNFNASNGKDFAGRERDYANCWYFQVVSKHTMNKET